jgi:colanic acid/amylovoran biosynthesis glycosyltransferase
LSSRAARICVVRPNRASYSERFIEAHIARLPAARALYGGWFPRWRDTGALLAPPLLGAARTHITRLPRPLRPPIRLATDASLAGFLRATRVEVLLAEYGPTGVEALRACAWARVPLVVHFHGVDAFHASVLADYGAGYRRLFARAAAIVAVSRAMERQLIALGAPPERIALVPYGADTERFAGCDPAAAPPHFVAVGRFVDKKAPLLTLLAFQRAHALHPEGRLTMAGDGPLLEACRRVASALFPEGTVSFPGPLSHAEVAALMRGARAFVQHSVRADSGDAEGTPVAILEAGAAGLPVVATRHGGIMDVVLEGETGLLVEEADVAAMGDHMLTLARDPATAGRLGRAAAAHVRANFSMERQIGQLRSVLDRARRGATP